MPCDIPGLRAFTRSHARAHARARAQVLVLKLLLAASPTIRNYQGSVDLAQEVSTLAIEDPGCLSTPTSALGRVPWVPGPWGVPWVALRTMAEYAVCRRRASQIRSAC
jgi:hypothetical protein